MGVQGQELRAQLFYSGQAASLFGASVSPPIKWRWGRAIPGSRAGKVRSVVCRTCTHTFVHVLESACPLLYPQCLHTVGTQ